MDDSVIPPAPLVLFDKVNHCFPSSQQEKWRQVQGNKYLTVCLGIRWTETHQSHTNHLVPGWSIIRLALWWDLLPLALFKPVITVGSPFLYQAGFNVQTLLLLWSGRFSVLFSLTPCLVKGDVTAATMQMIIVKKKSVKIEATDKSNDGCSLVVTMLHWTKAALRCHHFKLNIKKDVYVIGPKVASFPDGKSNEMTDRFVLRPRTWWNQEASTVKSTQSWSSRLGPQIRPCWTTCVFFPIDFSSTNVEGA